MNSTDPNLAAGVCEGEILAGKYRIERVLGIGGMGAVVAARHLQLDTKVAIKFLLPSMLGEQEAISRFAREARAAVKITSEHVARVFDVGTLDNGAPYMVMEFLEGGDLASWLKQRGPLPVEQAVEFVLQACVAVADAHGLGIIHRDLKPANLYCVRRSDGQFLIKVLDFGISKITDFGASGPHLSMTSTRAIMGSPLYMSPEQMQTPKDVDASTDIWSLGVVLFELLTGTVPFAGTTFGEIAVKVATTLPPPIRDFRLDVPPDLEAAIVKCLRPNRQDRHRNVAELAVAILPFAPKRARSSVERISGIIQASGLSASALDLPMSPPVRGTLLAPETIAPVGSTSPGTSPRARVTTAVILTALIVGSAAGLVSVFRASEPNGPRTGPPAAVSPIAVATAGGRKAAASPEAQVLVAPPLPETPMSARAQEPIAIAPTASAVPSDSPSRIPPARLHPVPVASPTYRPAGTPSSAPPVTTTATAAPATAAPIDTDPLSRLKLKP